MAMRVYHTPLVPFELDGTRYVGQFDFLVIGSLCDLWNIKMGDLDKRIAAMEPADVVTIVHHTLLTHQPDMTEAQARTIVGGMGMGVTDYIQEVLAKSRPPQEAASAGPRTARVAS